MSRVLVCMTPLVCRLALVLTLFFALSIDAGAADGEAVHGWRLLVDNKPLEARKAFEKGLASADSKEVGGAHRGLAAVAKFLGQGQQSMDHTFKSFLADRDTMLFNTQWINVITFGRTWGGHFCRDGYRAMRVLTAQPDLYSGEHVSAYADRLVNDGRLKKARTLIRRLGVVRSFAMIGPFDNISGSGYRKQYPPEKKIDFSRTYRAKDGAEIGWFPFENTNPGGWVFTENNYGQYNATLYYFANIRSTKEQTVTIGFGASGAFKVFLNDNLVLADSIFRNTGTDMFMQQVRLFAGDNKLLVKLCHETQQSNFLVRFMDERGARLDNVTCSAERGDFRADTAGVKNLLNTPGMDRMTRYLRERLAANPDDLEAAVLLMDLYNATELTDEGQRLARRFLNKYPASSLWHSLYSESLLRSRKTTDAQTALKTAYRLCELNKSAWESELEVLSSTAGAREVIAFVENSPELFRASADAIIALVAHHIQAGNESETMKALEELEEKHADNGAVVELLAAFYSNRGDTRKAERLLRRLIRWERASMETHNQLADLYMKMGQRSKALKTFANGLRYSPVSPGTYYYLAKLLFQLKDFPAALQHINKGLCFMPTSSNLLNLKGAILAGQGRRDEAIGVLRQSIAYDYNNFSAWDQLLPLEGKPTLNTLTGIPDPDSVITRTARWQHLRDGDNGSILAYVADVFMYPSRCSRERYFLMAHLPTQSAIDAWKEYAISYNSHYQILSISRAVSKSARGTETPADVEQNMVVFKTLQPGDFIVLEWSLENYFTGGMARHVWGEFSFDLPYPVHTSEMRFVSPDSDTIPFTIQGDSVTVSAEHADGFRITTVSRPPYRNPVGESFMLEEEPGASKVYYSTFDSWGDVADWYLALTENKLEQTSELKTLADSLLSGVSDPAEKVRRIHGYLTGTIRYSFVPFRQSAWVPQPAREVLATRIGDCKDMSSLAKSLFDYAGITSHLVLVNTRDDNSPYPGFIGPDFNHCIVSYSLGDTSRYLDMTDNNLSAENLPKMDQGALALVVREGSDSLIRLPLDMEDGRSTVRRITSEIDAAGTLTRTVQSIRTGIFAGHLRAMYRFMSESERTRSLQKVLAEGFPATTVDTLVFERIDELTDTLKYWYRYRVRDAAHLSSNTAIVPLNLPDRITGESFPSEEERHYDIDMVHAWFDVGSFVMQGTLTFPRPWRPITLPPLVEIENEYGFYRLSFRRTGRTILYERTARFRFDKPIAAEHSPKLREFLSAVAKADNVQLMFFTK